MRLKDKVCIITGAGQGIGQSAAVIFAREGAKVIVAELSPAKGQKTLSLVRQNGGEGAFFQVNVTRAADVQRLVEFAVARYEKINVLYNNAGILIPDKDHMITDLEEETWDKIIDTNLKSVYLCCKYVIPELLKSGGGSIINTSSIAGLVGSEVPSYCASKGGVLALTRAIAREYGDKGIRVNAICPGPTETQQTVDARAARQQQAWVFPFQPIPLGRMARPEEIASMALYLASDESSFITGAAFSVDGGWTAV